MSTLLAILLITRSSQNESSFTFSYPPDPAPTPRLSKPIYRKSAEIKEVQRHSSPSSEDDDAGGGATADGAGTVGGVGMGMGAWGLKKDKGIRFVRGEEDSGSGTDSDEEEVFETFMSFDGKFRSGGGTSVSGGPPGTGPNSKPTPIHSSPKKNGKSLPSESDFSTYLGLDTSALASALSPKKDLCDKKFEMVINALAFIGHPVWLGDKPLIKRGSPREGERVLGAGGTTTNGVEAEEGDRPEGRGRPRTEKQILNSLRSPTKASNQNRHNQQPPSTPTNSTGPLSATPQISQHDGNRGDEDERDEGSHMNASIPSLASSTSNPVPPPPSTGTGRHQSLSMTPLRAETTRHPDLPSSSTVPTSTPPPTTTALIAKEPPAPASAESRSSNSPVDKGGPTALTSFHVVLVIDSPPDTSLSDHLNVYYRDVVVKLTAAIKYEERRDRFLSRESERILRKREKAMREGVDLATHTAKLVNRPTASTSSSFSSICSTLAQLYDSIKSHNVAHLTFNSHIDTSILLHEERFPKAFSPNNDVPEGLEGLRLRDHHHHYYYNHQGMMHHEGLMGSSPILGLGASFMGGADRWPSGLGIKPWQTLLPLVDVEEMLKELPPISTSHHLDQRGNMGSYWGRASIAAGGAPGGGGGGGGGNTREAEKEFQTQILATFLETLSPLEEFQECAKNLDVSPYVVSEIAEHLVYWKKAKLIDVVSLKGVHCVKSDRNSKDLPALCAAFATDFPGLAPLPVILSLLSTPKTFSSVISSISHSSTSTSASASAEIKTKSNHITRQLRPIHQEALIWLLRRDLVVQLHMYVRIVVSTEIKKKVKLRRKLRMGFASVSDDDEGVSGGGGSRGPGERAGRKGGGKEGFKTDDEGDAGSQGGDDEVLVMRSKRDMRTNLMKANDRLLRGDFDAASPSDSLSPSSVEASRGMDSNRSLSLSPEISTSNLASRRNAMDKPSNSATDFSPDLLHPSSTNPLPGDPNYGHYNRRQGSETESIRSRQESRRHRKRERQRSYGARTTATKGSSSASINTMTSGYSLSEATSGETGPGAGRRSGDTFANEEEDEEDEEDLLPTVIKEPAQLTMIDGEWIAEMKSIARERLAKEGRDEQGKIVVQKFEEVFRFFNGRIHLDEIRYLSGLSRKEVKSLLDAFKDDLICFLTP